MAYIQQGRSIFENILLGVGTALNIANAVKSWQNQSGIQEGRNVEQLANRIKVGQSLAEMTGQPVQAGDIAEKAKKAGITWPKATEETQAKMIYESPLISQIPEAKTTRAGEPIEGRAVSLAEAARKGEEATRQAQTVAPVGGAMPIMPQGNKVAVLDRDGQVRTITVPQGVKKFMTAPAPATSYGLYDIVKGQFVPTGTTKVTPIRPYETPEQKLDLFEKKEGIRQKGRKDIVDYKETEPVEGAPGLRKPKSKTPKATGLYGNMKLAAQEHGLDLDTEEGRRAAMNLVSPGKMTDEKKSIEKTWRQVWKETGDDPKVSLPDGTKTSYSRLNPDQQKAWRQQNFEGKLQDLGMAAPKNASSPKPKPANPLQDIQEGQTKIIGGKTYTRKNGVLGVIE